MIKWFKYLFLPSLLDHKYHKDLDPVAYSEPYQTSKIRGVEKGGKGAPAPFRPPLPGANFFSTLNWKTKNVRKIFTCE